MAEDKSLTKASDFPPEVLSLFDKYVHNIIDRREFLEGAGKFAVGGLTAAALLEALSPRFAEAQQVPKNDPRIKADHVDFASPQGYGTARGYLASPATTGSAVKLPVILVIHENRGLNPHIEDMARRLALESFVAFAPDALFPLGGYPGDEDKGRELFSKLDQAKTREDFVAAATFATSLPAASGKVGAVGFCYGGGIVNFLATRLPGLGAGAVFYGMAPPSDKVASIKTPLLLHLAENDERINTSWAAYETALKAAGVEYEAFTYSGTQHGFNNGTTPRYEPAAATLAWQRTVAFFNRTLRKSG
jgi:carboxymethylenebutenolidase